MVDSALGEKVEEEVVGSVLERMEKEVVVDSVLERMEEGEKKSVKSD